MEIGVGVDGDWASVVLCGGGDGWDLEEEGAGRWVGKLGRG